MLKKKEGGRKGERGKGEEGRLSVKILSLGIE